MAQACNCQTPSPASDLQFSKCARGFMLREGGGYQFPTVYAFDHVEDLAAWLIEHFAEKSA